MSQKNDVFEAMIQTINVINRRADERHKEVMDMFKAINQEIEAIEKQLTKSE